MIRKLKRRLLDHISERMMLYIALLFIFICGAVCGVFSLSAISAHSRTAIEGYLNASVSGLRDQFPNLLASLWQSFSFRFVTVLLLMLCTLCQAGFVASFVVLIVTGFTAGFTVASMITALGAGAVLILPLCTILPILLLLIVQLYACQLAITPLRQSIPRRVRTNAKLDPRAQLKLVLVRFSGVSITMGVVVIVEGVISPILMHLLVRLV